MNSERKETIRQAKLLSVMDEDRVVVINVGKERFVYERGVLVEYMNRIDSLTERV